jgi:hypothetical protein
VFLPVGTLVAWQGDLDQARPPLEEAINLWNLLDEPEEEVLALVSQAWGLFFASDRYRQSLDAAPD